MIEATHQEVPRRSNARPRARASRLCVGCAKDISHTHGNMRWCMECRAEQRARMRYFREARRIVSAAIVKYMEKNTPEALMKIRTAILKARLERIRETGR